MWLGKAFLTKRFLFIDTFEPGINSNLFIFIGFNDKLCRRSARQVLFASFACIELRPM